MLVKILVQFEWNLIHWSRSGLWLWTVRQKLKFSNVKISADVTLEIGYNSLISIICHANDPLSQSEWFVYCVKLHSCPCNLLDIRSICYHQDLKFFCHEILNCIYLYLLWHRTQKAQGKIKKVLKNHMVDKYEIKNSTSCAKHGRLTYSDLSLMKISSSSMRAKSTVPWPTFCRKYLSILLVDSLLDTHAMSSAVKPYLLQQCCTLHPTGDAIWPNHIPYCTT